ncbi:hypothetical protein HN873_061270 [Arachis hypogaea]
MLSTKSLFALHLRNRRIAFPSPLSSSSSRHSSFTTVIFTTTRNPPFPWSCRCCVTPLVALLGMRAVVCVCTAAVASTPTIFWAVPVQSATNPSRRNTHFACAIFSYVGPPRHPPLHDLHCRCPLQRAPSISFLPSRFNQRHFHLH